MKQSHTQRKEKEEMKKCDKCNKEITPDLVVYVYAGYKRKTCKECIRKATNKLNKKKAKALKNWW